MTHLDSPLERHQVIWIEISGLNVQVRKAFAEIARVLAGSRSDFEEQAGLDAKSS